VKYQDKLEKERNDWKNKVQEFQNSDLTPTEFAKQNDHWLSEPVKN